MDKKLLVICFFPAFDPPASGGELRLLNLYRALSSYCSITMITSTDFGVRSEEVYHTPQFREIRFPKDEHWRNAYATLERSGVRGDLAGLAMALAVSDPTCAFTRAARELAGGVEAIIHEFPYSEPIFSDGLFATKEIYNSHNFEASLLGAIVSGPGFEALHLKLMRLEGNLARRAKLVLATSDADADKLRLFYGIIPDRIAICPNGFDDVELGPVKQSRSKPLNESSCERLLFYGSAHQPNIEAAQSLLDLAPKMIGCHITIAGTLCKALSNRDLPNNVFLQGAFDNSEKLRLLVETDVFINPVVKGSGTSLKMLEALGAGVPVLSTPEGARGLNLISGEHGIIADRRDFPHAIERLSAEPSWRRKLGDAGRRHAEANFTWSQIASSLYAVITAPVAKPVTARRPLVLAFNDYPVLDATWGGKARIRNLLGNLDSDVVLVTFGDVSDIVRLQPNFIYVVVPKTEEHLSFETTANDGQILSVNDCVASLFVSSNEIMRAVSAGVARRADVVIFEHCYMAPILDVIHTVRPGLPVIYSSHNVESQHRGEMLVDHSAGATIGLFVKELEDRLVQRATLVVCCTEADASHYKAAGVDILLVSNGSVVPDRDRLNGLSLGPSDDVVRVGFMGSGHKPNIEAARFILNEIIPEFPHIDFEILGSVCGSLTQDIRDNVVLHGTVDEAKKHDILSSWTVALNPVMSGGGSSLKLPDFMAHGVTTISTPSGARGFSVVEHGAGVVVDRDQFVNTLSKILQEPTQRKIMASRAYDYAFKLLSWSALTDAYNNRLREIFGSSEPPLDNVAGRSLLVVTYRYTEPSLGGAEEYMIEVLKQLRHRFDRIDLAAIDVGQITDSYHFGCLTAGANTGAATRLAELFDQTRYFQPQDVPPEAMIEHCRRLERAWMAGEFALFLPFAQFLATSDHLRLFSGFYGPEIHGGVTRRWTSPGFALLLPRNSRVLRLVGFGHREKTMVLTYIRLSAALVPEIVAEHRQELMTWFTLNVALPMTMGDEVFLVHCEVDEHRADGDHRPFGVLLESASVLVAQNGPAVASDGIVSFGEKAADLYEDKEQEIRTEQFEAWITALAEHARTHTDEMERDFAFARGPHSRAMQVWLAESVVQYGTVLIQGIPFDVIPRSVETLSRRSGQQNRVVTLPHFHGDDRFYYWRRYWDAFSDADKTLIFSLSIAERLDLAGRLAVVPGGGVRVTELGDLRASSAFQNVHSDKTPFFLVLGRKTASKGYRRILVAHQNLRALGYAVDLVMIGPDEDGHKVEGEGVYYLGRQPRQVIRGALSKCLALLNMSNSESFGIVLCEAWLFGKPVIVNRACYSFRELVCEGRTGWLVSTDKELADRMLAAYQDQEEVANLGSRGREEVLSRFTWQIIADKVYSVLIG